MTSKPALMTGTLWALFVMACGAMTNFYLLLSVVPLYATSGGAGDTGAGLTTAALMTSTVVGELGCSWLLARFGYRAVYAAGLVLLGLPALAFTASASMWVVVAVCLVRGLGFGIAVVVGSALVATLAPAVRRAEALGVYGAIVGVPSIVALPLGVWLVAHVGYPPVFIAAAIVAVLGLALVAALPGRHPAGERIGILAGLRTTALARPAAVFAVVAMAAGAVVTFVPLALASPGFAAIALFVQAATSTALRWWAGQAGDRGGSGRLLIPAVLLAGAGMLFLIGIGDVVATLAGMVAFGAGFGVAQNASAALMFERVPAGGYGTVSALWNLGYDTGLGAGAATFGILATRTGYPAAFAVMAALIAASLLLAVRDRAHPADHHRS